MKTRMILLLCCVCLLCSLLCACSAPGNDPIYSSFEQKEVILIVNGERLDVDGVYVYDGFEFRYPDNALIPVPLIESCAYATLPLVATLEVLGVQVGWQDEHTATLTWEDKSLILDLKNQTVTEPGKDDTWVHAAAGHSVRVRERVGQELLVDDTSMDEVLFYFFGNQTPRFTLFDWENGAVTVTVQKLRE